MKFSRIKRLDLGAQGLGFSEADLKFGSYGVLKSERRKGSIGIPGGHIKLDLIRRVKKDRYTEMTYLTRSIIQKEVKRVKRSDNKFKRA